MKWVPKGTLLNTLTVFLGGLIGWLFFKNVGHEYRNIAISGLGLVTLGIGLKMLLGSKNILVVAAAIALGGMLGLFLGIQNGIEVFADWAKLQVGATEDTSFVSVLITSSVLFCVGPMTLIGCMQDRLEGKSELLALKSTMDGFAAIFFGVASGPAIMVTALVILVFQSLLTFGAGVLKPVANDEEQLAELSAAGGVMLMGTGFGLLEVLNLPVANYLPALIIAPCLVLAFRRFGPAQKSG